MYNASWDWAFPEMERSYQIGNHSKNGRFARIAESKSGGKR